MRQFWFIYELTPGISPSDKWTWVLATTIGFTHKRDAEDFAKMALQADIEEMESEIFAYPVQNWVFLKFHYDNMVFRLNFQDYERLITEIPF